MHASKEPPLPEEVRARIDALTDSATAEEWKTVGNACFSSGCYFSAINCYTKALESGDDTAVIRSNRSAAYLKSPMFAGPSLALKDAERAVELDAGWYKAHLRLGDAQLARKKYEEAKAAYNKALELNSRCEAAAESLRLVERGLFLLFLEKKEKERKKKEEEEEEEEGWGQQQSRFAAKGPKCGAGGPSEQQPRAEEEGLARKIKEWTLEADVVENRTAMRAFNATLNEANREAGVEYKNALLSRFRDKVDTQALLRRHLEEQREREMRLGEGIDYRDGDKHRSVFMKGTNGIGIGISTDAYKSYKYESKTW